MDSSSQRRVAVLLAGGVGARIGLEIPKQLLKVAGRTILEHSLIALHEHPMVDEILIMMAPGHLDAVRAIVAAGGYDKVGQILEGGETRNDTTLRALDALGDEECHVLFHDAVRPFVSARIIEECFEALQSHPAVDVAIPSADTIIEVGGENTIREIPPRAALRRGQTPQAFRSGVIRAAYVEAGKDPNFVATDDCTVVLRYLPDEPIWVVTGDDRNMKVTEPIDVYLADKLFQLNSFDLPAPSTEVEYRAALAGKTMVVFGGSYGIGADIAELAGKLGAEVFSFSRSSTGTHVERRADIAEAAKQVVARTGRVDYVVNTAGVLPRGELVETSEETIYNATEVNYLAPVFIAQVFHPLLRETSGSLLLFTSSSYTRGRSGYSLYSSAKAATVNLTQALADEWARDGVRVNCINPERTATPMRTKAFGQEPPGSLLDSQTVAQTSLDVLLSPQTGHVYDVRKDDPLAAAAAEITGVG
ncbi:bifunctional cytidylyltransferase/SDR family oxidoreductase [Nocardioides sp. YIM 152315]|uniref:bifunctional cytidylyltransferase/SDR family oxidoreductase n=1 Tax=Nocardioides sp. YIM 152315 TaxID=3031760 RepID=UPI0023DB3AF6|nr:bifunctional cytidylyltransferase/SDR family oxidoreductase [Nocardioides sp. YIM 152315]MDF1606187.1 bifunctional cytidylyltransferase/SDR family oxidoreductase [Nocardioides sp. YIM 152315]